MLEYISNKEHYEKVIKETFKASKTLWIGTSDLKDMHVNFRGTFIPYLEILSRLISKGVSVRLIHAKEPGDNFKRDFDKHPDLIKNLERILCPRVHFKIIIIDLKYAYIGSANLTGAGMGSKSENKRNFETGIFTDMPELVDQASKQFDEVWMGKYCQKCSRGNYCTDRVIN